MSDTSFDLSILAYEPWLTIHDQWYENPWDRAIGIKAYAATHGPGVKRKTRSLWVGIRKTGDIVHCDSLGEAADCIGMDKRILESSYLYRNRYNIYKHGAVVGNTREEAEELLKTPAQKEEVHEKTYVYDLDSQTVSVYNSINEVLRAFAMGNHTLDRYANSNMVFRGRYAMSHSLEGMYEKVELVVKYGREIG